MEFKKYRRTQIAEIRNITKEELKIGKLLTTQKYNISISEVDLNNGSPKIGDMIARNPKNHNDQRLITKLYFNNNFEVIIPPKLRCPNYGSTDNLTLDNLHTCRKCNYLWSS